MHARNVAVLCLVLSVAGCGGSDGSADSGGGDGGSNSGGDSPNNASPGGIWHGSDPVSGVGILALIDEAGNFRFIRDDDVQYIGTLSTSGNNVSGALESLPERGTTFPDGSVHAVGTIDGDLIERQTLRVTIADQTDNGTLNSVNITLSYDNIYAAKSSLGAVVGNYTEAEVGTVFSVDATGHFTAQDAASGCSINGTVSIINPNFNVYDLQYSYSSCSGQAAILDGITATGKGTFTDIGVGAQVLAAVSYTVAGQDVGVVVELNRF